MQHTCRAREGEIIAASDLINGGGRGDKAQTIIQW